jgi:hypothetical protein
MTIKFSSIPRVRQDDLAQCVADRLAELGTMQIISADKLRLPGLYEDIRGDPTASGADLICDCRYGITERQQREPPENSTIRM